MQGTLGPRSALAVVLLTAALIASLWPTQAAEAHGDLGRGLVLHVVMTKDRQGRLISRPEAGEPVTLAMTLTDPDSGRMVAAQDLAVVHEKLFHFFAFDTELGHFIHEHPVYRQQGPAGVWEVTVTFQRSGIYHLWADVTPKPAPTSTGALPVAVASVASAPMGLEGYRTSAMISVAGPAAPASPAQKDLALAVRGHDGPSMLRLGGAEDLKAGVPTTLSLSFARSDGAAPALTNYLGALAHVVITNRDGTSLLHVHPMASDHGLLLHTAFPAAGTYRLFAQFIDMNQLRTVALTVRAR